MILYRSRRACPFGRWPGGAPALGQGEGFCLPQVPPGLGAKALDLDLELCSGRREAWCFYRSGNSFYAVTPCSVLMKDSDVMKNKEVDCPQRAPPSPFLLV